MDSVTQLLLGAAVADYCIGKKYGNKAIIIGMIAGTLPDLDIIINPFVDTVTSLDQHRGFTHSILFWLTAPLGCAWLSHRYLRIKLTFFKWYICYFWVFSTHALLDCFTSWGTQLFWPLSNYRVAFKSIFIIDPLYSIPLLLGIIIISFFKRTNPKRHLVTKIILCLSTSYLILTIGIKSYINTVFAESLTSLPKPITKFETKPTAFNTLLWSVTAESPDSYYIGYYSLCDKDKDINYIEHKKNHHLLQPIRSNKKLQTLLRITENYYTVEKNNNAFLINDLRFGQLLNWKTLEGPFVFTYKTTPINSKTLHITQVPRQFSETKGLMRDLFYRIMGKK